MTDHTDPRISKESESWTALQTKFSTKWSKLNLGDLWWLYRTDFIRELKLLDKSTPEEVLFDDTAQQVKKEHLISHLEENFQSSMVEKLGENPWTRFRNRNKKSLDSLRQRYEKRGLLHDYENYYDLFIRNKAEISERSAFELFDNQEKGARLFPLIRSARRLFRKRQERHFRLYNKYQKLILSIPDDELDIQLKRLAEDYKFIGRSREWYLEFEKMVNEVFDAINSVDYGQNEPVVRIMQNDFLLSMQGRFSRFWRYYELRDYCFRNNLSPLITQIGYFETDMLDKLVKGAKSADRDSFLSSFVLQLETELSSQERLARIRKHKRDQIMQIDHDLRMTEWAEFKHQYLDDKNNVVTIFNHLRPVLQQCTEWQHELRVFRSMILVKRLKDDQRKNSNEELKDARHFIEQMADRIDREISTDVAFRILEQNLVRDNAFLDDLNLVRKNIELQKELRSLQSADDIDQIKKDFVTTIWQKRISDEDTAPVTPLFAQRRSQFNKAAKKDDPKLYKR